MFRRFGSLAGMAALGAALVLLSVNVATRPVNDWPLTAVKFCLVAVIGDGAGATRARLIAVAVLLSSVSLIVTVTT